MTDETQQENEQVRTASPPAPGTENNPEPEDLGDQVDRLRGLTYDQIKARQAAIEWLDESTDADRRELKSIALELQGRRLHGLTDDELRGLLESMRNIGEPTDEDHQEITAIEIELEGREQLEGDQGAAPELNAANRICVQLRRIAEALGGDSIPFDLETDFNDIERVERRLMDIVDALRAKT